MKTHNYYRGKAVLFIFLLLSVRHSFAYIDPGTGSMMLQLLLAAIFGALFTIKMYWYKFKQIMKKLFGRNKDDEE